MRELEPGEARAIAAALGPRVARMLGDRSVAASLFWKEVLEAGEEAWSALEEALGPERIEVLLAAREGSFYEIDEGEIGDFEVVFTRDFKFLAAARPDGGVVIGAPARVLERLEEAVAGTARRPV